MKVSSVPVRTMTEQADEKPYQPKYKGFDEEATRHAQETAARANERQAGKGEYADETYMEGGTGEAAERMGVSREEVEKSMERAKERSRK